MYSVLLAKSGHGHLDHANFQLVTRLDPDDAELLFRKAVLHCKAGQPAEAEACWRRILTLKRPEVL